MLTTRELNALLRDSEDRHVLSVYFDARVTDPAMRHTARAAIATVVRGARGAITDDGELASFDRAASFLDQQISQLVGAWGQPGWVAFVTADGPLYTSDLPIKVPTLAEWHEGPFISPYLRVLKQHRPVVVALVDSRSARLFRYRWGSVTPLPELTIEAHDDLAETPAPSEVRATSSPAPRGALGTEHANRRRRDLFRRLASSLATRLAELANDDGWVLIGGTPEWARVAGDALPQKLADRTLVSATLDHDAAEATIRDMAKEAATSLRAAHGRRLLDALIERSGPHGRGAVGVPAVQRALRAQAVGTLLLTPEYLRLNPRDAEDAVRAAIPHGADIEVLSGDAAEQLDRDGEGIAAQLRFAIEESAAPGEWSTSTAEGGQLHGA